jgi:hypothetical protein
LLCFLCYADDDDSRRPSLLWADCMFGLILPLNFGVIKCKIDENKNLAGNKYKFDMYNGDVFFFFDDNIELIFILRIASGWVYVYPMLLVLDIAPDKSLYE